MALETRIRFPAGEILFLFFTSLLIDSWQTNSGPEHQGRSTELLPAFPRFPFGMILRPTASVRTDGLSAIM